MENANPILDNPLFIAAVLLFLVILPLALRQKKKSTLDRVLDQYEKEEAKAAAKEAAEKGPEHEPSSPPEINPAPEIKDEGEIPAVGKKEVPDQGGIPAFPETKGGTSPSLEDRGGIPFPDGKIKVVKEGVPISHSEVTGSPPAPRKKKKFTSEAVPISHNEEVVPLKETTPSAPKKKDSPDKQKEKKWVEDFYASPKKDSDDQESSNNWIEADIPGLIIEPLPEKKVSSKEKPVKKKSAQDIPTFNAPSQEKEKSKAEKKAEKLKKSSSEEKGVAKVKNLDARTVEKKAAKTEKPDKIDAETPKLEIKILDSGPKAVEKEAKVVSHKDISEKGEEKAQSPSTKEEAIKEIAAEISGVPPQREELRSSPEKVKPKPFFLDLKYLIEEELESAGPGASKKLSPEMVDRIVARLSEFQVTLESQLTSLIPKAAPDRSHGNMRTERVQGSPPGMEDTFEKLSDKKEVSLEELDSFLFTAKQRKNN